MIIKSWFLVLLLSLSLIAHSQQGSPGKGQNTPKNGIGGMILDQNTTSPVSFASVALYKSNDSSLVNGAITDEEGKFFIEANAGKYYLVVTFIGYERLMKSNLQLTSSNPFLRLGQVKIKPATTQIEGVDIVANQSYVDYKIDRKVVNVSKDLNASGKSAVEALENVPSITINIEGDVELRGSSNFMVLINGKPSALTGTQALEQIPSSSIKNIEIITNPSAKFDPDGMTGIINVILKEELMPGYSGMVELTAGRYDNYGFNGIFNVRRNKINYFVGADLRQNPSPGYSESFLVNYSSDTLFYRDQIVDRNWDRSNLSLRGGIDYNMDTLNLFKFEVSGGKNYRGKDFIGDVSEYTEPSTNSTTYESKNLSETVSTYIQGSTQWNHNFNKNEMLESYVSFKYEDAQGIEDQLDQFTSINSAPSSDTKSWMKSVETELNKELTARVDYTKKIKQDGKFEAGLQAKIYRETTSFNFEEYDTLNQQWKSSANYNSDQVFNRDIYSGYATYSNIFKNFGYQLGLRSEYTDRYIKSSAETKASTINRLDWFPTLHLSQKIGKTNSVMASYSRRIRRPSGGELTPNPMYVASNTIRIGNPDLQPEYTNSYELNYQKAFGPSFISLEAYHRATENLISRVQSMDSLGITYINFENINNDYSSGLELMLNWQLTKWFRLNTSGSYYHYRIEGELSSGTIDKSSNNYNLKADLSFTILPTLKWQITGNYMGPSVTTQGDVEASYGVNTALRYDMFNRRLSLTFNVRDLFNTQKRSFKVETSTFTNDAMFRHGLRTFSATLTYKINNYKPTERKSNEDRRESAGEDM